MKNNFDLLMDELVPLMRQHEQRKKDSEFIHKSLAAEPQRREQSRRRFNRQIGELETLAKSSYAERATHAKKRRLEARQRLGGMMQKAFGMFEAGEISGHELRMFEAKFNRYMASQPLRSAR